VTALVIGMLVLVGPVDALFLKLDGFKTTPYNVGETINFVGKIDINSNERVDLQNVSVEVNDQIVCTFDINANKLTACPGVNVTLVSNSANFGYGYGYNSFERGWNGSNRSSNAGNWTGYGYGYGYGYGGNGELVYSVSINSPQAYLRIPGNNEIKLVSQTPTQMFNSRTEHVVIRPYNNGGNNNFLFGYDNGNVLFWGRYESNNHTLYGRMMSLSDPSLNLEGFGTYQPFNGHAGRWEVLFYDSNLSTNYAYFVEGNYNQNTWHLASPTNSSIRVHGITYQGF